MAGNRINRINEEIHREIAALIREMKDPRVRSFVSVTNVSVTSDLRYCKVYISVLDESKEKDVMAGLKSAAGFLRRELGSRMRMRYTPELIFEKDDSIKHGAHIFDLLEKLGVNNDEQ